MNQRIEYLLSLPGESITRETVGEIRQIRFDNWKDASDFLFFLLQKENIVPVVKAALITSLLPYLNESNESVLLSFLGTAHAPVVKKQAVLVLMQVATVRLLPEIEKLASHDVSLQFLHTIACHRLGLISPYFKLPGADQQSPLSNLSAGFMSRTISAPTRTQVVKNLSSGNFNLGLYGSGGLQIECINKNTVILFHKEVLSAGFSDVLQRPSILGAIARWNDDPGSWSFSRIVVAGPLEKNKFYVVVYRRNGQTEIYGTGSMQERTCELRSVKQPGNANLIARFYWHGNVGTLSGIIDLTRNPSRIPLERIPQ